MIAAGFMTNYPNPADPFYRRNMINAECPNCEQYGNCPQSEQMPVISELSRYFIMWDNDTRSMRQYPFAGGWDRQPTWFIAGLNMARRYMNEAEERKRERERQQDERKRGRR